MQSKYNKLFLFLGLFMFGYGLFMAGFNVGSREGVKLLGDFVLAGVGAALAAMIVKDHIKSIHDHNKVVEKLADKLADKIHDEVDPETKADIDDLVKVMLEVTPDGPPKTDAQLRAVEAAYHESTGNSVALSFRRDEDGGILGMDSEFSHASPEAAVHAPGVKVPVSAGDAPKPLTKSQQRRINDKRGKGPYTDAELKEQANEKRRAARLAKKSETEGTTLKERIGAE